VQTEFDEKFFRNKNLIVRDRRGIISSSKFKKKMYKIKFNKIDFFDIYKLLKKNLYKNRPY